MRRRIRPHCSPRTARGRLQIRLESQVLQRQTSAHEQKGFLPPAQRRDARHQCRRKILTAASADGLNVALLAVAARRDRADAEDDPPVADDSARAENGAVHSPD